ncbi:MAG: hypothetical protein A2140_04130 [Candidatus Muproteobacteria bacterium RBG_16_62_13]|uniref:Uncharacterized protein n=1 Tax=Candidatus Muproteobacteria bacterium RBG_16_62_13 TaxID=1817756 RepID=A0A1F6T1F1_9PROT|nr:MAG: hypothetical protein A2140_04130 [Candidatus Muproteobacteria bacterium RBG_16_62_13]
MKRQRTVLLLVVASAGAIAIAALGLWWWRASPPSTAVAPDCQKVLYWTDPMVPGYRSEKPGKSPFMDMQLVPVCEQTSAAPGSPVVTVRAEIIQRLGVRTHKISRGTPARRFVTTGYVFRDNHGAAVLVDLFGRETGIVRVGGTAEIRNAETPGRVYRGRVETIEADLDIGERALKARVRVPDADQALPANLLVEVAFAGTSPGGRGLYVPREALIRTGQRTALVLALGEGRFRPVEVEAGVETDDWIEIRRGVREGDVVVTSGQFLLDSESNVRAGLKRMEPAAEAPSPPAATTPVAPGAADPHAGH